MRQLDHFHGYPVKEVAKDKDGWYVELENGIKIINTDPAKPFPTIDGDVTRLTFITTIMEADSTQIVLGVIDGNGSVVEEWRATFNPLDYQIYDPETRETVKPQAGGYGAVTDAIERRKAQKGFEPDPAVPPHPDERVQEQVEEENSG